MYRHHHRGCRLLGHRRHQPLQDECFGLASAGTSAVRFVEALYRRQRPDCLYQGCIEIHMRTNYTIMISSVTEPPSGLASIMLYPTD